MSDLDIAPHLSDTDNQDRDKFSHYVFPKEAILEAAVTGEPVTALCGKTWVPTRDPDKFGICPECKERYDSIGK